MVLDWKCGAFAEGLECYRRAEFFMAHEHWEDAWRGLEEPEKSFVQALIQVAAALHHEQKGNAVGAASMLRKALRRLELCPASFAGIAVQPLRAEVRERLRLMESGDSSISLAPPQICLIDPKLESRA